MIVYFAAFAFFVRCCRRYLLVRSPAETLADLIADLVANSLIVLLDYMLLPARARVATLAYYYCGFVANNFIELH